MFMLQNICLCCCQPVSRRLKLEQQADTDGQRLTTQVGQNCVIAKYYV